MKHLFGDNIRDAIAVIRDKKAYNVEFPLCYHPELTPTEWDQPRPEPVRTIGRCPLHDYTCPLCGFGAGCAPSCNCSEMR